MPLKKQFTNGSPMRSLDVLGERINYAAPRHLGSRAAGLLSESQSRLNLQYNVRHQLVKFT